MFKDMPSFKQLATFNPIRLWSRTGYDKTVNSDERYDKSLERFNTRLADCTERFLDGMLLQCIWFGIYIVWTVSITSQSSSEQTLILNSSIMLKIRHDVTFLLIHVFKL